MSYKFDRQLLWNINEYYTVNLEELSLEKYKPTIEPNIICHEAITPSSEK